VRVGESWRNMQEEERGEACKLKKGIIRTQKEDPEVIANAEWLKTQSGTERKSTKMRKQAMLSLEGKKVAKGDLGDNRARSRVPWLPDGGRGRRSLKELRFNNGDRERGREESP